MVRRSSVRVLRTPDARFEALPDFPFQPHYLDVADGDGGQVRVHYLDEGPPDGPVVLLLHGEPTWAYLYRTVIPPLVDAGLRAVVPDMPGFGRSDKPTRQSDYTYARHVAWMRAAVTRLDLRDATLVGQDWGGLVGLRLVAEEPDRYARVVASNHGFPTGDRPATPAFLEWLERSQSMPEFPCGEIVARACLTSLTREEVAAYDAPHPDDTFKAGARVYPALVPIRPDDPASDDQRRAWRVLETWTKPFLTAFSDSDPITAGAEAVFQSRIPGAAGQPHATITKAGHNLQEDAGPQLAEHIVRFVATT
jgi:haloalkane dehalogenase